MTSENKRSAVSFVHNLIESVFQDIAHDQDAINELYAESGLNRDELVSAVLDRIKLVKYEQRAKEAREKQKELLMIVSKLKERERPKKASELLKEIKSLLSPAEGSPTLAFFHQLESMPEEDLMEILSELDTLPLIKEVQKKQ
jgi:hypothetical protein